MNELWILYTYNFVNCLFVHFLYSLFENENICI